MFDMKKKLRWSKLKVGLVISLALLILLLSVFFAGKIENLFIPRVELKAQFRDVRGLRKGAPVWIFGTEIGSVKEIQLSPTLGAIVTISIQKKILDYMRRDAQASVMTMGLLGDKYIELTAGSPQAEPIRAGEMIRGTIPLEFSDVMETASISIGKIGDFIQKLDNLIAKIETGEGTIAKLLTDPSIYDHLDRTAKNLSLTLEEIKQSRGTLKRLLEDPTLYQKMISTISTLEAFAKEIRESPGTLKRLIEDPSLYDKTVRVVSTLEEVGQKMDRTIENLGKKMDTTISTLELFGQRLNEREGTLQRLIEDPQLYDHLDQGAIRLNAILEKVDRGEGLAGALLRDREMVRELRETVVEFKETASELKKLIKDIKEQPRKYLKFSLF
jgi:phospholipid/cholesterol/gamma-HCH transport system substrate-binding protein